MAKVLVTGGLGNLGKYTVPRLVEQGHDVTLLVRPSKKLCAAERIIDTFPRDIFDELMYVEGSLTDLPTMPFDKKCLPDTVLHMAASLDLGPDKDWKGFENNVNGTQSVIDFVKKRNVSHLGFVSTAFTQDRNRYESSKKICEGMVEANAIHYSFTIMKPSVLIGSPQDPGTIQGVTLVAKALFMVLRNLDTIVKKISDVTLLPSMREVIRIEGNPDSLLNILAVDTASLYVSRHFNHPGEVVHVTNPNPPTVGQVASEMGRAFDVELRVEKEFKASLPEKILHREIRPIHPYLDTDQAFPSIVDYRYRIEDGYITSMIKRAFGRE